MGKAKFYIWFLFVFMFTNAAAQDLSQKDDQILRYALHSSKIGNLDPDFAKESQSSTYASMVFNGLLRYKPGDSKQIEPDLAVGMPTFEMIHGGQVFGKARSR